MSAMSAMCVTCVLSAIRRRSRRLAGLMGCCLTAGPLLACLPLAPKGAPAPRITDEAAIILWDKQEGVEHFIRRATFATTADRLAFLVPTPATPQLNEASDTLFTSLEANLKPPVVHWTDYTPRFHSLLFPRGASVEAGIPGALEATKGARSVEIIAKQTVSGYDATILRAGDADALNAFLAKNGYPNGPTVADWLRPYTDRGWIITAFKVHRGSNAGSMGGLHLPPVRMTFPTTHPFYPYREPPAPVDGPKPPRSLRIFVVSQEGRMAATLGENGPAWGNENFQRWLSGRSFTDGTDEGAEESLRLPQGHAGVEWAGQCAIPAPMTAVYDIVPPRPSGPDILIRRLRPGYLTVFTDTQSPRPGTDDLYFSRSVDQSEIKPAPVVRVTHRPIADLPVEPVVVVPIAIAGVALWRRRRTRQL